MTLDHAIPALGASLGVLVLAGVLMTLTWRSYRATGNDRVLFVAMAFLVFMVKSGFVAYNVVAHAVPHDSIEFVSALFDLVIVALLFVPFIQRR